jgi:4-hydroxy-tetrahydrodipicolinate synthase
MFNATCDSFSQTRDLALFGQEQGADAITVLPPYYLANAPKQGIIDYLNLLADALSIPYILYNFPKHTQNPLTPDMLAAIRHAGIKDSSADISLIPHTPRYLIGSDLNIMKAYKAGACGYVTARGNVNPEPFVTMENALAENDMGKTEELQKKIATIASLFTGPQQIPMIKKALSEMLPGYPAAVRLPLKSLPVR